MMTKNSKYQSTWISTLQIELERLNTATDDINKLEVDLDVSITVFRVLKKFDVMKKLLFL